MAIHPMPSNSKRLQVWGISTETVDAYALDGRPKKLIRWVSPHRVLTRMACDENGKLLFGRCCLHWCWRRLHAWDTVVLYSSPRYITLSPFNS
jgi:hypothetical protein